MPESERRQALADFLRKQRARLAPADVGLPAGTRRHTPGLRREEVAYLANMGTSWYIWLEQGRDVHPSTQVLEGLAQALRLTPDERRHLFLLAGLPTPPPASSVAEHISPAFQQMLDDLDPAPAYVIGRHWDYLAWNKAADAIFSISRPTFPHARNLIWRLFTNPGRRTYFPDWERMARGVLAEFRTASASVSGDQWLEKLLEDLKEASPEFCQWWPHHDARSTLDAYKAIEHPKLGLLEFEHITLQIPSNPNIRVTIYEPDATTRAKLELLLEARPEEKSGLADASERPQEQAFVMGQASNSQ